jgi:hypothetical protein
MTLNASGPISLAGATAGQSIAVEMGLSSTAQISLNCTNVRTLAGVPTGAIVMPTNFYGKPVIAFGCATYTTSGTFSFVVPTNAYKICVVCVGRGTGGGAADCCCSATGGGGGALSYTNCIATTPGETLTVFIGNGAPLEPYTSLKRGSTVLVSAAHSNCGCAGGPAACGVGAVKYSGGASGNGGGGAAGYAGNGGKGGGFSNAAAGAGSGGGGGGGGGSTTSIGLANAGGAGGGGVGLIVQGTNGTAGTNGASGAIKTGGGGGSSGTAGANVAAGLGTSGGLGGTYGGGGGGGGENCGLGGLAGFGAVRIIYGGTAKTYPNNSN